MAYIVIKNESFCCYLTGCGEFAVATVDIHTIPVPAWVTNQGEFKLDGLKWDLAVGISREDEEWRQDGDIKHFLNDCFLYLEHLKKSGNSSLTLCMSYSVPEHSMVTLDPQSSGLLSSLNMVLEVFFSLKTEHDGTVIAIDHGVRKKNI